MCKLKTSKVNKMAMKVLCGRLKESTCQDQYMEDCIYVYMYLVWTHIKLFVFHWHLAFSYFLRYYNGWPWMKETVSFTKFCRWLAERRWPGLVNSSSITLAVNYLMSISGCPWLADRREITSLVYNGSAAFSAWAIGCRLHVNKHAIYQL